MTYEKETARAKLSRRGLLERSVCTMATLAATPWLARCAPDEDELDPAEVAPQPQLEPLADSTPVEVRLPRLVAGIRIPDTKLAQAAADLAFSASPETLYNHCMRTYLFSSLVYKHTRVKYDAELTFVASALHDLGLVEQFMTENERFEVDGADAAVNFLKQWRVPAARAEVVWDAIALHTSVGIATRKAPEVAAISIGAAMDTIGRGLDQLSAEDTAAVIAAYPRLDFKRSVRDGVIAYCQRKPNTLLLHPWESVARRHIPDLPLPFLEDLVASAPFSE